MKNRRPTIYIDVTIVFIFLLLCFKTSKAQSNVAGIYTKTLPDFKAILNQKLYHYKGQTSYKLILKKKGTFKWVEKYQAKEFRQHSFKGKVFNFKLNQKNIHWGTWSLNQDTLLLKEKQLGYLYFLICESNTRKCLCEMIDSKLVERCAYTKDGVEIGYTEVFRKKKRKKELNLPE